MIKYDRYKMRDAIDKYVVNPRYRNVFLLKYYDGYSHEEVAEKSNYSTQHVKYICKELYDSVVSGIKNDIGAETGLKAEVFLNADKLKELEITLFYYYFIC